MSTPANSADEVFSKLTQFDESKHHRNHGQFSSNGGGGRDHWAGLKHGAGVGARIGAVLGGVPSTLAGAAAGGYAAHQLTHLGNVPGELNALGRSEEEIAQLKRMGALSGGKKALAIGGSAAVTGLASGVSGALHGGVSGAVLGGAIGAGVGRKRPTSKEESQAFVEGAKAAHEHNHGKDDDVAKNLSSDVSELFGKARGTKELDDVMSSKSPLKLNPNQPGKAAAVATGTRRASAAPKEAVKTANALLRHPKVAMGVGLGVAGAGAAGAYYHMRKNDDVSSDVAEVFGKARQFKSSTSATIGGGLAGAVGGTLAGHGLGAAGEHTMDRVVRGTHLTSEMNAGEAAAKTGRLVRNANKLTEAGRVLRSPKGAAIAAGAGAAVGGLSTLHRSVEKSYDTSADVAALFSKARETEVEKGLNGLVDAEKIGGAVKTAKTGLGNIGSGVANGVERMGNKSLTAGGPKKLTNGLWHASDFARKNKIATGAAAIGAGTVAGGVAAKKTF